MSERVVIALFEREADIVQATRAARSHGLEIVDVFTPYAVHGLDRAMGLPPSRIPWVTFILGAVGAASMAAFQFWASAVDWAIDVGGKPWNSWPAFTPVVFEVAVLLGGVGTVLFFLAYAGLRPGGRSPVADLRVTDDRFALVTRVSGTGSDRASAAALFGPFHAVSVEERPFDRGGRAA